MVPWSKSISGTTYQIFTKFSEFVELLKGSINPAFISQSLKRRCHGNQLSRKIGIFNGPILIVALPIWNGLEYTNADKQPTSYTNLLRFGGVTPEERLLIFVLVWKNCKNGHIWPLISEHVRPTLSKLSALIEIWVGMINLTFVSILLKGRCYGNQLIWGTFLQTSKLTAFSLCSGVPKRNAISPSA